MALGAKMTVLKIGDKIAYSAKVGKYDHEVRLGVITGIVEDEDPRHDDKTVASKSYFPDRYDAKIEVDWAFPNMRPTTVKSAKAVVIKSW